MMDRKTFKNVRMAAGAIAGIGGYKFIVDLFSKGQKLDLLKGVGVFGLGLMGAITAMTGVDTFARAAEETFFKEPEVQETETEETDDEEEEDDE